LKAFDGVNESSWLGLNFAFANDKSELKFSFSLFFHFEEKIAVRAACGYDKVLAFKKLFRNVKVKGNHTIVANICAVLLNFFVICKLLYLAFLCSGCSFHLFVVVVP